MRMLMSFEIQPGFSGIRNFSVCEVCNRPLFRRDNYHYCRTAEQRGCSIPGVGSEAQAVWPLTTNNEVSSDAAYGDTSAVDAGYSEMVGNTVNGSVIL